MDQHRPTKSSVSLPEAEGPALGWLLLPRKENTQGVLYSDPGQRVLYAFFTRFLRVFYLAQNRGLRRKQVVRCGPPQPPGCGAGLEVWKFPSLVFHARRATAEPYRRTYSSYAGAFVRPMPHAASTWRWPSVWRLDDVLDSPKERKKEIILLHFEETAGRNALPFEKWWLRVLPWA